MSDSSSPKSGKPKTLLGSVGAIALAVIGWYITQNFGGDKSTPPKGDEQAPKGQAEARENPGQASTQRSETYGREGQAASGTSRGPSSGTQRPERPQATDPNKRTNTAPASREGGRDAHLIVEAMRTQRSEFFAEVEGKITRKLRDDLEGSRHQKVLMRLPGTRKNLMIVHNIDLVSRVPWEVGDTIKVYGEYIWKDNGGLLHYTHKSTSRRKPGGWIEHEGVRYE